MKLVVRDVKNNRSVKSRKYESSVFISAFLEMTQFCSFTILGDPGAVSGGGEKSSGREKNSGEEKSRRKIRAPGDKVLTDQFQTVGAILASDWCQKIFVFFLPNHRARTLGVASCSPTRNIHTRLLLAICWPRVYSRRKVLNTAQNVGEIRQKVAGYTLNISQVS